MALQLQVLIELIMLVLKFAVLLVECTPMCICLFAHLNVQQCLLASLYTALRKTMSAHALSFACEQLLSKIQVQTD